MARHGDSRRTRRALGALGTVTLLTAGLVPAVAVLPVVSAFAASPTPSPHTATNTGTATVTFTGNTYLLAPTVTLTGPGGTEVTGTTPNPDTSSSNAPVRNFDLTAAPPGAYDVSVAPPVGSADQCSDCFTVTGGKPSVTKVNNGNSVNATNGDKTVNVAGTNLANKATIKVYKAGVLDPEVTATVGTVTSLTTAPITLHFPNDDAESGKRTVEWKNTDDQTGSCTCLTIAGSDPGTKPAAPTAVHALPGNGTAQVSWTKAGDGNNVLTGYRIDANPGTASVTVGPTATSAVVTGLINNTAYTFTVRAINGNGSSNPGGPSNSVRPHAPTVHVALPSSITPGGSPTDFTLKITNDTITAYPKARIELRITGLPGLAKDRVKVVDTNGGFGIPVPLTKKPGALVGSLPSTGTFALGAGSTITRPFAMTLDRAAPSGSLFVVATVLDATHAASPVAVSADLDDAEVKGATTRYVPVTPLRFVDTHNGVGLRKGRHSGDSTITVPQYIPDDAQSVALSITVADPSRNGSLQVFPAGRTGGNRTLSYRKGHDESQMTVTPFSGKRKVTLRLSNGSAHFIISVLGYETDNGVDGGRFVTVTPRTIGDTRGGAIPKVRTVSVHVPNAVPSNAVAVLVDVTAVHTRTDGVVKVFPKGGVAPIANAVSFVKGASHTGAFLTKVGTRDRINLKIKGKADVVVDLVGYYAKDRGWAGRFDPITPTLIVNATKSGVVNAALPAAVPDGATGAVMAVTAHAPSAGGVLRAFATGAAEPSTTVLSWAKGGDASAYAVSAIGTDGRVSFHVKGGATRLQVEVIGYLTG